MGRFKRFSVRKATRLGNKLDISIVMNNSLEKFLPQICCEYILLPLTCGVFWFCFVFLTVGAYWTYTQGRVEGP